MVSMETVKMAAFMYTNKTNSLLNYTNSNTKK